MPVHPRACGEQWTADTSKAGITGSSPRMRGTETQSPYNIFHHRFIPAHAGNRRNAGPRRRNVSVHPRACGEQQTLGQRCGPSDGSSPRMRGTVVRNLESVLSERFIPAHAGNRLMSNIEFSKSSVHPRACGEQRTKIAIVKDENGSSPRMRGTEALGKARPSAVRFIPAHAGNSLSGMICNFCGRVHPRACGEQNPPFHNPPSTIGSSPRMRGTDLGQRCQPDIFAVHPRACGEQVAVTNNFGFRIRFIPAHAGNSGSRW